MATEQATVDYIIEQVGGAGEIRSRKMFGEYALYCDEKVVAFICDNQLLLKITDLSQKTVRTVQLGHAYPGSKEYLVVDAADWDDHEYMTELIRVTASDLPTPKPKKPKR